MQLRTGYRKSEPASDDPIAPGCEQGKAREIAGTRDVSGRSSVHFPVNGRSALENDAVQGLIGGRPTMPIPTNSLDPGIFSHLSHSTAGNPSPPYD
jgi:hypothetical protein